MAQLRDEQHGHTLDGKLRRTRVAQGMRMHALLNACLTSETGEKRAYIAMSASISVDKPS